MLCGFLSTKEVIWSYEWKGICSWISSTHDLYGWDSAAFRRSNVPLTSPWAEEITSADTPCWISASIIWSCWSASSSVLAIMAT